MIWIPVSLAPLATALKLRRQRLAHEINFPVLLWAGRSSARNFPANRLPFRASSHFLYFAGLPLEGAVIRLEGGQLHLFLDDPSPSSELWHGPVPSREEIADAIGADLASPIADLAPLAQDTATVRVQDPVTQLEQERYLARTIPDPKQATGRDLALIQAIVKLRLTHDQAAQAELRRAAAVTMAAHRAGMAARATVTIEASVKAVMEQVIAAQGMTCAYASIVTVQGEVLHNEQYHHALRPGELLLADVGAETETGWAGDVTRTWPVSGKFSSTQRDLYDIVLAAHDTCIAAVQPGIEYRALHLMAAKTIAAGLLDLKILQGDPDSLVEQDAHALFFPHGIGHLLGLDVHDMEDLGDIAGYAPGRQRSDRLGLKFLRLDRPLEPGMAVTIEPGFYQIPALLNHPEHRQRYSSLVNWDRLATFADVRGIRIEDDVLVTETGHEVLTAELPTHPDHLPL